MSRPQKRLGQHFLSDSNILRRIADALDPAPGDVVVEIGPGKGSLTRELLARGLRVIAIERDARLAAQLRAPEGGGLIVVEGDALRTDWHRLVTAHGFKVVGNIPYQITTPLIEKALTPPLPERIVFLVQAEVAQRLAARPGSKAYGALSVGVQAVCRVERLFAVRPGAFRPPPKVHSALVRLTPLAEPLAREDEIPALRRFVTACFSRRRKQLRNALMAATGAAADVVGAGLARLGLAPALRPEAVAPAQFVALLRWARSL